MTEWQLRPASPRTRVGPRPVGSRTRATTPTAYAGEKGRGGTTDKRGRKDKHVFSIGVKGGAPDHPPFHAAARIREAGRKLKRKTPTAGGCQAAKGLSYVFSRKRPRVVLAI